MPSQLHEALLLLFRNRPTLAPELLEQALRVELPVYSEARIESADLTDVQPAEYRADLVVLLCDGKPVLGIVVEVQLRRSARKRFTWPAYVAALRARIRCPVCLLVVTTDDAVARWAARAIDLGGGNSFTPLVVGPSGVPVVENRAHARSDPELAVLSAMAHGRDANSERALRIALVAMAASIELDAGRATLYFDLVAMSLSEAARKALREMDPAKYEYQSDFAKHYIAIGEAKGEAKGEARGEIKGEAKGKAELLERQLARRFGRLPAKARKRLAGATSKELDAYGERLLSVATLDEVFAEG